MSFGVDVISWDGMGGMIFLCIGMTPNVFFNNILKSYYHIECIVQWHDSML
jgi:hypothetical protein